MTRSNCSRYSTAGMASPDGDEWGFPNRATPLGSPAYYAVRFSPEDRRQRSALLLAWHAMIDDIVNRPRDPGVARIKLDWWRNEIATLANGQPRHPLAVAMRDNDLGKDLVAPMQRLIDAAERAIVAGTPRDDAAFAAACRASEGALFALLGSADGGRRHDRELCIEAGAYCAAVERVRHVAVHPERLPPDVLEPRDGARRAARFESLFEQFAAMPCQARLPDTVRRLTALAAAMQRKLRRSGYPVFDTLVDRPPIAHLWTAWRCR